MKVISIGLIMLILSGIVYIANSMGCNIPYILPVIVSIIVGWLFG